MRDLNDAEFLIRLSGAGGDATVETNKDGQKRVKRVSTEDLVSALAGTMKIDTGLLPAGTRFYAGSKGEYRIGIGVPGMVRTASFSLPNVGKFEKRIPFPHTLFSFRVSARKVSESQMYAFVPPLGNSYQRLHRFPLGNVFDNGQICWGSVKLHEMDIREPVVLDSVVNRFFSSVFSGHLVHGVAGFHPPEGVTNLQELIDHLEGMTSFPKEILRISDKFLNDLTRVGG